MSNMPTPEGQAPIPESDKTPESHRMANIGEAIVLKKLGRTVYVKELSMESVIRCAGELAQLLAVIDFDKANQAAVILQMILQSEPTARAARVFAAESTGTQTTDWENAPVSDWLKFVKAARNVHDWEELRELFTELGIPAMLAQFRVRTTETELPSGESEIPQPG